MRNDVRYPAKPIERPEHISALTPTRGRPENLTRLFDNFQETVADKNNFDVWIYVDDDDQTTLAYIASNQWLGYDYKIYWHVAPASRSMGEMFNILWQVNSSNPGIYFPCCDDVLIDTRHWDIIFRKIQSPYNDGIMLGFLPEQTAAPYQVTYPVPSAAWLNAVGYFFTNRFYYWFDDMWLDDIAQMAGRKVLIPVYLKNPEGKGKTPRLRNLPFWTHYYCATLDDRYAVACRLFDQIFIEDTEARSAAEMIARKVAAIQLHKNRLIALETMETMEDELASKDSRHSTRQLLNYLETELMAVQVMLEKLQKANAQGDSERAVEMADFLEASSYRIPDIAYLKAYHLDQLGYHADALTSVSAGLQLFQNDLKYTELLNAIEQKTDLEAKTYDPHTKSMDMPAWLELPDTSFLLFPEEIDQELFFTIQRIIYDVPTVTTMLDIGAGNGNGSTRAMVEASTGRMDSRIYCIEPDPVKCRQINNIYADKVKIYQGLSVAADDYISEHELKRFYQYMKSIYNFFPYSFIEEIYHQECRDIRGKTQATNMIQKIKQEEQISEFDLVVMDGSLFTGKADLAAVYGSKYLVLNYAWSTKNYYNLDLLLHDENYKVATGNLKSRCGYVVFERV